MNDVATGWPAVYPHVRYADPVAAVAWLTRVFGFAERVRMSRPDGRLITSKMETPGGGLVMVAGTSADFTRWVRDLVPSVQETTETSWPNLSHLTTVMVEDVDAHHERARAEGATILMPPTDQPWGLRSYAAFDPEGHQWEFSLLLCHVEPEAWGAVRIL